MISVNGGLYVLRMSEYNFDAKKEEATHSKATAKAVAGSLMSPRPMNYCVEPPMVGSQKRTLPELFGFSKRFPGVR